MERSVFVEEMEMEGRGSSLWDLDFRISMQMYRDGKYGRGPTISQKPVAEYIGWKREMVGWKNG